jgi:hypothetical protein
LNFQSRKALLGCSHQVHVAEWISENVPVRRT